LGVIYVGGLQFKRSCFGKLGAMGALIAVESSLNRAMPTAGSRLLALAHRVDGRVRLQRDPYKR